MRTNGTTNKALIFFFSLIVTILIVNFCLRKFTEYYGLKKNMINDSVTLMKLVGKAARTKDSSIVHKYSDSCLIYFEHLPDKEKDSLRSFFAFIISVADSLDKDALNSIKDNGSIDTTNMFRPTSKLMLREWSKRMDIGYYDLLKGFYALSNRVKIELKKMNDTGNITQNIAFIRHQTVVAHNKRDSIYNGIYNRMFAANK